MEHPARRICEVHNVSFEPGQTLEIRLHTQHQSQEPPPKIEPSKLQPSSYEPGETLKESEVVVKVAYNDKSEHLKVRQRLYASCP